jgi:hypothetical protein
MIIKIQKNVDFLVVNAIDFLLESVKKNDTLKSILFFWVIMKVLQNKTIKMAFLWSVLCISGIWGVFYTVNGQSLNDPEFNKALTWAHSNGMTKFNTETSFMPTNLLTREQGAKFFAEFARNELWIEPDMSRACNFTDINQADPSLVDAIILSCQLWLFQWSNGAFDPQRSLTKAQAVTVLVRALVGKKDENQNPRWNNYFQEASTRGWTKEPNAASLDKPVSRYEVLLMQYRPTLTRAQTALDQLPVMTQEYKDYGIDMADPGQLQASTKRLSQILQELFGEDFQE